MRIFFLMLFFLISSLCLHVYALGRQKIDIKTNWKFKSEILSNDPASVDYDDESWSIVDIPHCWNATDAQDGGGNYLRTVGWYRKIITWNNSYKNKKLYLELQGACLQTECFVNGESVGTHKGGYTAFRVDITSKMRQGNNIIALKVDNRLSEEIMPLGGDFSIMGGMYRGVCLIVANQMHVDLMDSGSSGLYLTTSNVSETKADLEIKANVFNNSTTPRTITIDAILKKTDTFDAIADVHNPAFDISSMYQEGDTIKEVSKTITILPGDSFIFKEKMTVDNPRLWNGKQDPYRYLVDLQIKEDNVVVDKVSEYIGFRYFSVTKDGFFLNGNLYPLRGVNRHQDRYNMGYAITAKEHNEDFGMMYDMGANAIRFAHYPHDSYIYDLCDRYGLIAWAEIPLVDRPGMADRFNEVTKNQLRELIRQQYNRPSIFFWGLQNEIRTHHDAHMQMLMKELNDLAHFEDSSRLTVQASNHIVARNWDSDLFAWNYYPGWYVQNPLFGSKLDDFKISESRPTALSEYGAGGSIYHHESIPEKPITNGGKFHPEEYQNKVHEQAIIDFSTRNFVWGTFLWNMFDFASDNRNEGDHPGMNDKGLVTYDRKVKKDSYYAYKANWNREPMVYISSRRYIDRKEGVTPVTVYSNCESVELFVNNTSIGRKILKEVSCGFFRWENVELLSGENKVKVVAVKDSKEYTDEVIWNKVSENIHSNTQDIDHSDSQVQGAYPIMSSNEYKIDFNNKTITIPATDENKTNLPIDKFLNNIAFGGNLSHSLNSISYFIQENDELIIIDSFGTKTIFKLVFGKESNLEKSAKQYLQLIRNLGGQNSFPKTYNKYTDRLQTSSSDWWCSGFYPGTLLYLYQATGLEGLNEEADRILKLLEKEQYNKNTHDIGFMMYCSFGNANRISPSAEYQEILINSANSLISRFNPKVGCIKSHNRSDKDFVVIIDNMMNLELLFWATEATKDSIYYHIAVTHANTTMDNHFRADNSLYHGLNYNLDTGRITNYQAGQGYSENSSWSRGQAWGLYGYTMMFRFTNQQKYLEQAIKCAEYQLNHPNMPNDLVPYWDYNAPDIPFALRDASAAAINCSALFELSQYVDKQLREKYFRSAEKILSTLSSTQYTAPIGENGGFILKHSVGNIPTMTELDVPLTYADYYYVEALFRYKNMKK